MWKILDWKLFVNFFWFNKIIGQKCFGHKKLLMKKFRSSKNVGQEAGAELGQSKDMLEVRVEVVIEF